MPTSRRRLWTRLLAGLFIAALGVLVSWELVRVQRLGQLEGLGIRAQRWTGPWGEGFTFAGRRWLATPTVVVIDPLRVNSAPAPDPGVLRTLASLPRLKEAVVASGEGDAIGVVNVPVPGLPALLTAVCANPSLENLRFYGITLAADSWSALAAPGPAARLRDLGFHGVPMSDRAWGMLAGMTELRHLSLAPATPTGDAQVAALTAGPGLRKLTDLSLFGRGLTADCVPHLTALISLKNLQLFNQAKVFHGLEPGVPEEDLKKALPGVKLFVR